MIRGNVVGGKWFGCVGGRWVAGWLVGLWVVWGAWVGCDGGGNVGGGGEASSACLCRRQEPFQSSFPGAIPGISTTQGISPEIISGIISRTLPGVG